MDSRKDKIPIIVGNMKLKLKKPKTVRDILSKDNNDEFDTDNNMRAAPRDDRVIEDD